MRKNKSITQYHTRALLECLRSSPLLVDDLLEAVCFDRGKLFHRGNVSEADDLLELNFSQKLGHLYEDALRYLLEKSPDLELLGNSVQIFNDKRITLGELDYIIQDRSSGTFIHLELAVKFYLIRYIDGEPTYPGPDPRDNWLNKLARMREHQLQLATREHAQRYLLDTYEIEHLKVQHLIYGKLFDHYLAEKKPNPPAMRADCQRGKWKFLHEWQRDSTLSEVREIPKALWPAMQSAELAILLKTIKSISRDAFIREAEQRCTMIWDGDEQDAIFIAPDTWGKDDETG